MSLNQVSKSTTTQNNKKYKNTKTTTLVDVFVIHIKGIINLILLTVKRHELMYNITHILIRISDN
jgi:hypothetical protein